MALEPMPIHAHVGTESDRLVVLVHGLNGERYATWGDFASDLFDRLDTSDLGFYGYLNGFRRWNVLRSISIEDEAQVLIDTLRDSQYQNIILLGHSLGGVLIRTAVAKMVEQNNEELLSRLRAAILFAVPQLGAHSLPWLLSLLNSDAAALKRNSPTIRRTTRIFLDHFETTEVAPVDKAKRWLPVYCVQAAEDFWVTELSSTLNIPSNMRKVVRGSHTEIVKGFTKEVADWVATKVSRSHRQSEQPEKRIEKSIRLGPSYEP